MNSRRVGSLLAVLCMGLLAGIYLGDVMGARHARMTMTPAGFVQMQQAIHVHFVRLMPPLILGAVLGKLLWLWGWRQRWRAPAFWLLLLALLGVVAIAVMTRLVNVPLNMQLMSWNMAAPPAQLRALWQPWEWVNLWRLGIAMAVFLLELLLLIGRRDGDGG